MTKTGIIVTAPGIIIVASTSAKIHRFPGASGNLAERVSRQRAEHQR